AWDNGRPDRGDWSHYVAFMNSQLAELLTRYGDVGGIWFDGMWDKPDAPWQLDSTYGLIHRLQPAALVVPNHHQRPRPGEDVQTFEQDLPGANSAGFNTSYVSGDVPLETSLTMNGSWGFNITDKDFKSVRTLVGYLVRAAGNGANLLLNVGPRRDGGGRDPRVAARKRGRAGPGHRGGDGRQRRAESARALMDQLPVILAITGASGAPYGVRLLEVLALHHVPTWLMISSHGWRLLTEECGIKDDRELRTATGGEWRSVRVFDDKDRGAEPASGSARTAGMVICPCSMGTVAAIAHGTSRSLVERAADVTLKERRKLIL